MKRKRWKAATHSMYGESNRDFPISFIGITFVVYVKNHIFAVEIKDKFTHLNDYDYEAND